jgi:hypothetical protein
MVFWFEKTETSILIIRIQNKRQIKIAKKVRVKPNRFS